MAKKESSSGPEPEAAAVTTPATTSTPAQPAAKRVVYLGPSVAENGVFFQHGKIFNNGLPKEWQVKAAADPEFKLLLVPVARAAKSMVELKDSDSFLAQASVKVRRNHSQQTVKGGQK